MSELEHKLLATTDAEVWAHEFLRLFVVARRGHPLEQVVPEEDAEGLMVGWFANAIETGRTAGQSTTFKRPS